MKTLVLLISMTISISSSAAPKDKLTCVIVPSNLGNDLVRCENSEVICYKASVAHNAGMSCKFKEKK